MGIQKGEAFVGRDVFVDYSFEEVMFRWDHANKCVYRKFYGSPEGPQTVPHDNRLFNDALLYGEEITRDQYMLGKGPRPDRLAQSLGQREPIHKQPILKNEEMEKYQGILVNAFPASLKPDVLQVLRILPLTESSIVLRDGQTYQVKELIHSNFQSVILNDENLRIPSRLYINEPSENEESHLSEIQKAILNCIFLCHYNGFVRQRRLENLAMSTDHFIVPYAFKLLGEYVIEILDVLDPLINENTIVNYAKFIHSNPKYWILTQSRVVSYWNEYYRHPRHKFLHDYIGYKIIFKLNAFVRQAE